MYATNTINHHAELKQQRSSVGTISGASGACIGMQEQVRAETELEREMNRLQRAEAQLEDAVAALWERLGRAGVLSPPTPMKDGTSAPIEVAQSQLGNAIQSRALAIATHTQRLYDLMAALCI